jgi:uncharacterized membrane protein YkvA (DUF1232 family)
MKVKKSFEKRVSESRFFREAKLKAEGIAKNPELLNDLIQKADKKALEKGRSVLGEAWDSLATCFRMLRAYARGEYRNIPWKTLVAIIGAMVYFVMPLDFIPDFIFGFGFTDDVALILLTVKSFKDDIENYAKWEKTVVQNINVKNRVF